MRYNVFIIGLLISQTACTAQIKTHIEAYNWISFESMPKDATGKLLGVPTWDGPHLLPAPVDTFIFYPGNDSIRMITPDRPVTGSLFKRFELHGYRWKPKPDYFNKLFFVGTYLREDLPGLYFSFYVSKDRKNLLQIHYTNPGNMNQAIYLSNDSTNIFKQAGKIIDPIGETPEAEKPIIN